MKYFVGLDFAFANNGIVIIDENADIITSELITSTPKKIDEERLFNLIVSLESYLEIGDIAVWIGVIAAHRGPAFSACRYVIDEIKHRLPIWKKEHYKDKAPRWVSCHEGEGHGIR